MTNKSMNTSTKKNAPVNLHGRVRFESVEAAFGRHVGEGTAVSVPKIRNSKEVLAVSELIPDLRLPPRAP